MKAPVFIRDDIYARLEKCLESGISSEITDAFDDLINAMYVLLGSTADYGGVEVEVKNIC